MAKPGKGGKRRASDFFSLSRPIADLGPSDSSGTVPGGPGCTAPDGGIAPRPLPASAEPVAGAPFGAAPRSPDPILSAPAPGADRRIAPDREPRVAPSGQVCFESDPHATSGAQTKPVKLGRVRDDLADLVDSTFGDTPRSVLPVQSPATLEAAEAAGIEPPGPPRARPRAAGAQPPDRPQTVDTQPSARPVGPGAQPPVRPKGPAAAGTKFPAARPKGRGSAEIPPAPPARPRSSAAWEIPPAPLEKLDARSRSQLDEKYERLRARVVETPRDVDLIIRLASLCADLGRNDEALTYFKQAGRLAPQNGFVRQRLRDLGGDAAVRDLEEDAGRGDFSEALRDFLSYPFQGSGLAILATGAIFFGLVQVLPMRWVLRALLFAYLAAYQFKVIQQSARGVKEPPDWPDLSEATGSLAQMAGCYLAAYAAPLILFVCGIFALNAESTSAALSLAAPSPPAATSLFHAPALPMGMGEADPVELRARYLVEREGLSPEDARRIARAEFGEEMPPGDETGRLPQAPAGHSEGRRIAASGHAGGRAGFSVGLLPIALFGLALLTFLAGSAYFPMALLIAAIFNTSRPAFNYVFGLTSAARILPSYVICGVANVAAAILIAVIATFASALIGVLIPIPFVSPILASILVSALSLYQMLALSHLVGRLYYHNEARLGWL